MIRTLSLLALLALVSAAPARAQAPAPGDARAHFDAGMEALDAGRFRDAAVAFERSFELAPRLPTAFNWALALRGLGAARTAERLYERLLEGELGTLRGRDRAAVEALRDDVRATIGTLRLTLEGPHPLEARLDGEVIATEPGVVTLRVDPGEHVIVVTALDHENVERRFRAEGDAELAIAIRLVPRVDERPGILILRSSAAETYFVVGERGEGPAPLRLELLPGRYDVLARGRHGERHTEVEVPPGRRIALTIEPPEGSWLLEPWFWIVAGVVVAGLVAGTVAVTQIERRAPPLENEVFPTIFALTVGR